MDNSLNTNRDSRRKFFRGSSALLAGALPTVQQPSKALRVGLVGCGRSGRYLASQVLSQGTGISLVAMCDLRRDEVQRGYRGLRSKFPNQVGQADQMRLLNGRSSVMSLDSREIDALIFSDSQHAILRDMRCALAHRVHGFFSSPQVSDRNQLNELAHLVRESERLKLNFGFEFVRKYTPASERAATQTSGTWSELTIAHSLPSLDREPLVVDYVMQLASSIASFDRLIDLLNLDLTFSTLHVESLNKSVLSKLSTNLPDKAIGLRIELATGQFVNILGQTGGRSEVLIESLTAGEREPTVELVSHGFAAHLPGQTHRFDSFSLVDNWLTGGCASKKWIDCCEISKHIVDRLIPIRS